jgi:hypothetical protein
MAGASRAALASGFAVPPSDLSGASAVLDAFRDRSMVVAGENGRARDQCADHECQRYDLSCHSIPRMAALCDLAAGPVAPRPHAGYERGFFPFVDVEVSRFVRGGSGDGRTAMRYLSAAIFRMRLADRLIPDMRKVTRPWWFAGSLRVRNERGPIADIIIAVPEVNRNHQR